MNRTTCIHTAKRLALGLAVLALAAAPSFAQTTIDLCATTGTAVVAPGVSVPIWGFVLGSTCAPGDATLPNPVIRATAGEALTVNLTNNLPEPVSFFVPGLRGPAPTGAEHFTTEAVAGGTAVYAFTPDAGTYLYQSATSRIRTQVPKGLYGALVVDVAPGEAYPGVTYDQDQVLVYSAIDPDLDLVNGARVSYNNVDFPVADVSEFDYGWKPQYFLINGKAHDAANPPIAVTAGEGVLLRFVNAGLDTVVPTLEGGLYVDLIAEDGNPYPAVFSQYGLELQPGKTFDAMITIPAAGTYALYDRALNLTNGSATGGGMLIYLQAGAGPTNTPPVAVNDAYSVDQDTQLVVAAPGVLGNDTDADLDLLTAVLFADVSNGSLTLNADGSFTYMPNAGTFGIDTFTYVANDGTTDSNVATVTITVNEPGNTPPVANDDAYSVDQDTPLVVAAPGVLANDTDADGDALTAAPVTGPANGGLGLNPDGSFTYTPTAGFVGIDTFTYVANDGTADSNVATVTITVTSTSTNNAPVAFDDEYGTVTDTPLVVAAPGVLANDTDADSDPLTAALVADVTNGSLSLNADGSFTYTPDAGFIGIDSFTYMANDGTVDSNVATVAISVGPPAIVYFSTVGNSTIPGVAGPFDDADIYTWDGATFGRLFDASVAGLAGAADVDGLVYVSDTQFYVSFITDAVTVPGGVIVDEEDVVYNDAGTWSIVFDGSAEGLTAAEHDIDAFDLVGGILYFSTLGNATITGVPTPYDDADIYSWDGAAFARVFDASAAGLPANADIDALHMIDAARFCVSLLLNAGTVVPGLGLVQDEDIICYNSGAWSLYLDGSAVGLGADNGQNIDAINIVDLAPNAAPIAVDDSSYLINQDTVLSVAVPGVLGNDTDADLDLLTAVLVADVSNGSLTLNADGSFTYTPNAGSFGADSFTYVANDGVASSAPATVTITVNEVGPPPTMLYFSTVGTGTAAVIPGVAGPYDDADIYSYSWVGDSFARVFDGSTAGLAGGADIDGIVYVSDTQFYMSFNADAVAVPVLGTVDEEDIVFYDAGTWTLYFDGGAAGLSTAGHDIDAFTIVGDVLYFSTVGNATITGVAGPYDDADIYSWDGATTFARVFDASAAGLADGADIDGLVLVDATHFDVSFLDPVANVPGVGTVQDEDIVNYNNGVWSLSFVGGDHGLNATDGQDLDAIDYLY